MAAGWALVRRRGAPALLTIAIHVLLLLAILMMARVPILPKKAEDELKTFSLSPDPAKKAAGNRTPAKEARQSAAAAAAPATTTPPPRPAVKPPPPDDNIPGFLHLSSSDFAASDIGKLPRGASTGSTQGNSRVAAGPGEGPGGVQLFEAEWYREPTDAELSAYLPPSRPRSGWGIVACQTIEHYHVDNCQQIGESPPGSGFARAVRQAAWQFLVRPPRIDGKPQIGSWVRIRIEYNAMRAGGGAGGDGPAAGPDG